MFSAGSFFIYKAGLSIHRSEIKSYIKANQNKLDLTIIDINPSELYANSKTLKWEDENKEVIYNGELFDVVSISSEKGHVILKLLSDEQEKQIKDEYASVFSSSSNSSNHPLKLLKQFLALKFLSNTSVSIDLSPALISVNILDPLTCNLSSAFIGCEVPPPDFS